MSRLKYIAVILLSFCIVFSGLPVQAKPQCPMGKMQLTMEMGKMADCAGMAKAKPDKNNCCDDTACSFQCSTSASVSIGFISEPMLPQLVPQAQSYNATNDVFAFFQLNTQERPPKSLS